jgi:hypothetical protein
MRGKGGRSGGGFALATALILALVGFAGSGRAQQAARPPAAPAPAAPAQAAPAQAAPAQAAPVPAPASNWIRLPRMQLERQFAGPLQDTVIQRWRDPVDGTVCYIYLPITVQHSAPTPSGYVEYGPNGTGSISCFEESAAKRRLR